MACGIDIPDLEARLMSGDLEIQVTALERAKAIVEAVSKIAVEGFKYTNNPVIYADRLSALGRSIVPHLELLYTSYEKGEPRTELANLLLFLGSRTGLSDVLSALNIEDPSHLRGTIQLAKAGVVEAVKPITNLLRAYASVQPQDFTFVAKINTLICALEDLGAEVPDDIRERFKAIGVSKYFDAGLTKSKGRRT